MTIKSDTRHSQLVIVNARQMLTLAEQDAAPAPRAWVNGSQKTENPYAMPMQRWIASAQGGNNQRL
jgi:hypothetical protein